MIPKKPQTTQTHTTPDEFISQATAGMAERIAAVDLDQLREERLKVFPLRIPKALHIAAAEKAKAEKLPLHDFILVAIKEKISK